MNLVASIIILFTTLQLVVALTNFLLERNLPESDKSFDDLVSVLIPARNEEKNIENILADLTAQDHKNIEVIVFNDQSEDNTASVVNRFVKKDKRVTLINSDGLPEGWLGKNYACHKLSEYAKGKYFLFLDADVRVWDKIIDNAVAFSGLHNAGLISIFPKQKIVSLGEKITVPNMNFILLSLLPLILVRKLKFPSIAAANGQFMFFKSDMYNKMSPHKSMKCHKTEDIAIARAFKKNSIKVACLLGDNKITCRMYNRFSDAVNGFSKNVIEFFGGSFITAILFWLVTSFGFLFVLNNLPPVLIASYVISYILTRIFISAASRQNIFNSIVFIIPLQVSLGLFIYKAFINKNFRKFQWKGRIID